LFRIPGYSPQLNPDEWVWKNIKHNRVGGSGVSGPDQFKALAVAALRRLQRMPHIVRGSFADPTAPTSPTRPKVAGRALTEALPFFSSVTVGNMDFARNPDLEREMTAAQEAIDVVTADYLGADVELVMAQLKRQFAVRGINLTDDGWLRKNSAEPIASGQPVIVVEDVEEWDGRQ